MPPRDLPGALPATRVEWLTVYFIHTMDDPWITALRWAQAHGFSAAEIRAAHSAAVMLAL